VYASFKGVVYVVEWKPAAAKVDAWRPFLWFYETEREAEEVAFDYRKRHPAKTFRVTPYGPRAKPAGAPGGGV
jgi:hypothetical protein